MQFPQFDLSGSGAPIHFLHANGYPPECYQPLLELLNQKHRVFGMKLRPLWDGAKPEDLDDWHPLSDDLLRFLSDREPDPVIGIGHSIGGIVTLRAAIREPEKFRALILLDPVLFLPSFLIGWNVLRAIGLGEKTHPLIAGTKKRRRTFDDLETIFRGYRTRPIFRYLS
ncbi:MAG TPA: alpha/beta fold hydrolase, partial [Anaerolineales bacterium]|nr:alpha/beta fold hydrolase [Anaerolineales bacterium]